MYYANSTTQTDSINTNLLEFCLYLELVALSDIVYNGDK